ncbi:MAG TPA: 16S rRNA (guanine(527)-N(7))-methyltransferase RsmG [Thermomicrobiales bacterium]|jgi:16S rRNA (guanine527-N7)-methyltransferase|nr:16S rRNA (guanine(527)-N(7))-methyltransferase RsmG [Thermomicrobiales bacterium]
MDYSAPEPTEETVARDIDAFTELTLPLAPDLTDRQIQQLATYRDMLYARNKVVNLTAVRDYDGIERRLVLESLRIRERVDQLVGKDEGRIMDLGSGGGIPGIVLAITLPQHFFTLLDATGKKVTFLRECIEALGLENATAIQGRAEELGHDIEWRSGFDVVTARAVTSLSALLELGLPFVQMKGWLVLPKGPDIEEEMSIAKKAAGKLGGTIVEASFLPEVGSLVDTRLVLVRKDTPTPGSFPRRVGLPAKAPLGTQQERLDKRVRRGKNR